MSAPWLTTAEDAGDAEDERRGPDEGPLLSILTKTAAPEASAEPVEPTPGPARGGGGGTRAGGGDGRPGGGGGGAHRSNRATAWWRAERVLPTGCGR